jgi:hypothetical protein
MANLTLSIDEKLLQAARVRAVKERTSVNEICRQALEAYARASGPQRLERYLRVQAAIDAAPRTGAPLPAAWKSRDEMYGQVLDERHPTLHGVKKKPRRAAS